MFKIGDKVKLIKKALEKDMVLLKYISEDEFKRTYIITHSDHFIALKGFDFGNPLEDLNVFSKTQLQKVNKIKVYIE